jgi:hypothetical protein
MPSGSFQQAGRSVEVASTSLQVGDFDDNKQAEVLALGASDLIGRASAQVIFFSRDGEQATRQSIPGLLGSPVVGRFADSPYAGISFSTLPGIAMLIGRRDRQFFPRSYPSFPVLPGTSSARIYAIDLLPSKLQTSADPPGEEALYLADEPILFSTIDGNHSLISTEDETILANLPRGPEELLGDILWGKVKENLYCPTLIFPFQQADRLFLFQPCREEGDGFAWNQGEKMKELPLPPGVSLRTKPVLADIDEDGHLDLLIGANTKAREGDGVAFVAYGDGQGSFRTQPGGKGEEGFFFFTIPESQAKSPCGFPVGSGDLETPELAELLKGKAIFPALLAVAELDGDGKKDLIFPFGVCTSANLFQPEGDPLYKLVATSLNGQWTEAQVLDLNGDGRLDVAVGPEKSKSLEIFLNSPNQFLNPVTIPLNGSPGLLHRGDFDGDGSIDLAFRERGVQGTSNVGAATGDALTILFTSPLQVPREVTRVGRFEQIDHLTSGITTGPLALDAISDLAVISQSLPLPGTSEALPPNISLFYGSSDRALRSPFILQTTTADGESRFALPVVLVPGRFTPHSSQAQQDLLVIGTQEGDSSQSSLSCPGSEEKGGFLNFWLIVLGGDAQIQGVFPGPSLDFGEVGGLDLGCAERGQSTTGDLDGDGFDEVIFAAPTASGQSKVFVGRTRGNAASPEVLPPLTLTLELTPEGRPVVLDVDSDGKQDALLLVEQGGVSQLAVLWGKGDGTFEETPSLLALPEQPLRGLCGARAGDGRQEVLLLGDTGLFRLGASRQLAATPVEQFTSEQKGGVALACGDLDGDGVDDVAISSGSLLRVFRGLPVRP